MHTSNVAASRVLPLDGNLASVLQADRCGPAQQSESDNLALGLAAVCSFSEFRPTGTWVSYNPLCSQDLDLPVGGSWAVSSAQFAQASLDEVL